MFTILPNTNKSIIKTAKFFKNSPNLVTLVSTERNWIHQKVQIVVGCTAS